MTDLLKQVRFALRALARKPTLSLVAVMTLVLGIGANTAIFSLVKAVLLNPLPYESPEDVVVLWERKPEGDTDFVSAPTFEDWRRQAESFEAIAAYRHVRYSFLADEEPLDLPSLRVTPALFSALRSEARLGRTFTPEEAVPGGDRVVVLSDGLWRRHFGQDAEVVGTHIELDQTVYTVVGVMAPEFAFPPGNEIQLWTPLSFDPNDRHGRSRRARALSVVGRLRAGVTLSEARQEMDTLAARLAAEYPDSNTGWGARVESAHEQLVAAARPALLLLLGAVGFLLLIVCVNVASLMLARLTTRRREIALHAALGAGRLALVRQVLMESFLLSAAGAALGLASAYGIVRVVQNLPLAVTTVPRLSEVAIDSGVLWFTASLSVLAALAFGLLPAVRASRPDLRESLGESARGGSPRTRRVLGMLVTAEVALALVLLVGAGLTLRSFREMMRVDPGFTPTRVLAAQIYLTPTRYADTPSRLSFFMRTLERVRSLPGVESAAAVSTLPMHPVGIDFALPFSIEGRNPVAGEEPRADIRAATDDYFQTMKVPLLEGRLIDERDREQSPHVVVINETLARRYFPSENPMGKVIDNPHGKAEVIGVIADIHHYGLDAEPRPELYLPFSQNVFNGMSIVVRTARDPETFSESLRRAIWEVDAEQSIYDISTMDQAIARWVFLPRLSMTLLGAFAAAALLLAGVGIYGVIAYSVSQRTTEMGLRLALGADAGDLVGLVVKNSMRFVGIGMLLGVVGSALLARFVEGQLFGVSPFDPVVFVGVSLLLAGAGLVASYLPARRATRVDPIEALRVE